MIYKRVPFIRFAKHTQHWLLNKSCTKKKNEKLFYIKGNSWHIELVVGTRYNILTWRQEKLNVIFTNAVIDIDLVIDGKYMTFVLVLREKQPEFIELFSVQIRHIFLDHKQNLLQIYINKCNIFPCFSIPTSYVRTNVCCYRYFSFSL